MRQEESEEKITEKEGEKMKDDRSKTQRMEGETEEERNVGIGRVR